MRDLAQSLLKEFGLVDRAQVRRAREVALRRLKHHDPEDRVAKAVLKLTNLDELHREALSVGAPVLPAYLRSLQADIDDARIEVAEALGMTHPGDFVVEPQPQPPEPGRCPMGGYHTAYPSPDRYPHACVKCGRHAFPEPSTNNGGVTS